MPPLLTPEEISDRLKEHAGWRQEGDYILRDFRFAAFTDAMSFVNRVAEVAEEIDHHPDITINYNKVRLTLSTHSEGGVTQKDLDLAARIEKLAPK